MQYLLLIYGNEESFGKMTEAERNGILKEYGDFTKSIAQSGHYRGGKRVGGHLHRDDGAGAGQEEAGH